MRNNVFNIDLMIGFGLLGYIFKNAGLDIAPFTLGFVLGDMFEEAMRQSLVMSRGDLTIFFSRPISAFFMIVAMVLLFVSLAPFLKMKKPVVEREG